MRTPQVIGSILVTAATAFFTAQGNSGDNKPEPKPLTKVLDTPKKNTEKKFSPAEADKLLPDLGHPSYKIREKASAELFKMSGDINYILYILNEAVKPRNDLEVSLRVQAVEKKALEALKQRITGESNPSKVTEETSKLIKAMDENRSLNVWKGLTPIVLKIIENKIIIVEKVYDEDSYNNQAIKTETDLELIKPLSNLLLSVFNKDSKELQQEALKSIISLAKEPYYQPKLFILLNNLKLKALTRQPLNETETVLKELRELYPQLAASYGLVKELTSSTKPFLEELLEGNIDALSSSDTKKQKIAMNNINALQVLFDFSINNIQLNTPQLRDLKHVRDLINAKNVSLIFSRRQEFYKNITSAIELQSSIQTAQSISDVLGSNISYHKGYINWLEKQIDNPVLQKLPNKEEIENMLEDAIIEELFTLSEKDKNDSLQVEIIRPLIKAYIKLTKQSNSNSSFLKKNLQALVDFQYFTSRNFSIDNFLINCREKTHDDLLALFNSITNNTNKLSDKKERAHFRMEVVFTLPYYYDSNLSFDFSKEYTAKLSNFYCTEQNSLDITEFMKLTDSLLNLSDVKHPGKHIPSEIMLQFIEDNPKYFERNIKHIIKTYKESDIPGVKSASRKQLQEIYLSFHRLFNERQKAAKDKDGYLIQHYPVTRLQITGNRSLSLEYRDDLCKQIVRIENWFNKTLEKQMAEIISLKGR